MINKIYKMIIYFDLLEKRSKLENFCIDFWLFDISIFFVKTSQFQYRYQNIEQ